LTGISFVQTPEATNTFI